MTHIRAAAAPGLPGLHSDPLGDSRGLAALVSAAAAPPTAEHPDAVLLDLGRQWLETVREAGQFEQDYRGAISDEQERKLDARFDREMAALDAIIDLPASTIAGLAVKARILTRSLDIEFGRDIPLLVGEAGFVAVAAEQRSASDPDRQIVGSLVTDIFRLAQEAGR